MGNIVGEGFKQYVSDQIRVRQEKIGSLTKGDELLRYLNSNTGWVKATSTAQGLSGDLADEYVLFGGSFYGLTNTRDTSYRSYTTGWPEQSPRPQPGITSMETKNRNRGSVRETTINIKAFDKAQFEYIDLLFMRLGYSVLIEFGHTIYYNNEGVLQEATPANTLSESLLKGIYDNKPDLLQQDIAKYKENSDGNYDAIFGRITNFNWSYNAGGVYDITVTLISYGDVVESLKINIGVDSTTLGSSAVTGSTEGNDSEVIVNNKNQNIFTNLFYKLKKSLDDAGVSQAGDVAYLKNTDDFPTGEGTGLYYNFDAIRLDEKNWADDTEYYYIRFGALLQFMWDRRMIYYKNGKSAIEVDVDIENNLMYLTPYTVSTNLKACAIKNNIEISGNTYKLFNDLPDECDIQGAYPETGKLMNIYINMSYITKKMEELKDNKNQVVMLDLLTDICNTVNSSLGGVNQLAPVIDEEENRLYIIEEATIPNIDTILQKLDKKVTSEVLRIYGTDPGKYGTFVTDFGIKTEISSELASTLTIGAQANGTSPGEDATAFSTWNAGLVDRVLPEKKVDRVADSGSFNINENLTILQKYVDFIANVSASNWDEIEDGMESTLTNMLSLWRSEQAVSGSSSSNSLGFIPINLNLTMKGLSGMKIYNKLVVASDFLPRTYENTLYFLVKGITHKVEGNKWTTTLDSLSIPKNITQGSNSVTVNVTPALIPITPPSDTATAPTEPGVLTPTYVNDPSPSFRAKSIFNGPNSIGKTKGVWSDLGGPSAHLDSAIRRGLPRTWQNTNAWDLDIPAGAYIYAMDSMIINSVGAHGPYDPQSNTPHLYGDYFTATLSDGTQAYYAHLGSLNSKVIVGGTVEIGEFVGTVAATSGWDPHLHLALIGNTDLNQKYLDRDEISTAIPNPQGRSYDWKRIGTFRKASAAAILGPYQKAIKDMSAIAAQLRNDLMSKTGETSDAQEVPRMDTVTKKLVTTLTGYVTPSNPAYKTEAQAKQWVESAVGPSGKPLDKNYYYAYIIVDIVQGYDSPNTFDSDRENEWEALLETYASTYAPTRYQSLGSTITTIAVGGNQSTRKRIPIDL